MKVEDAAVLAVGATKTEMGDAIGRRPTGVLGLARGPMADRTVTDLFRLARFRASQPDRTPRDGEEWTVRNSRALRDVPPKRTSAEDETPPRAAANRRGDTWTEEPRKRAVG